MEITCYHSGQAPQQEERDVIINFLFNHLGKYGDPKKDIKQCFSYAMGENHCPGGFVLTGRINKELVSAVIINKTQMSGFIPENILVYVATHPDYRGRGLGGTIMKAALERAEGGVALHVEADNPAKRLYERLGFTNKYLEMRYKKEA